jgi:hypothetical protein
LIVAGFAALAAVAVAIVFRYGKSLLSDEHHGSVDFTLSDLREMHRLGRIDDDEFQRLKDHLIERGRLREAEDEPSGEPSDAEGAADRPDGADDR